MIVMASNSVAFLVCYQFLDIVAHTYAVNSPFSTILDPPLPDVNLYSLLVVYVLSMHRHVGSSPMLTYVLFLLAVLYRDIQCRYV